MLSLTCEHALRALVALASSAKDVPVVAADLSAEAGVPLKYLYKILGTLTKAGLLKASRGPKGGYRLARAADQIPLINIVELFDGINARPDCLFGGGRECSNKNPCSGHEPFKRVRQGINDFLESTTIADIGVVSIGT